MVKWADFLVSKVKYNSKKSHIIMAQVHKDKHNKVGKPSKMSRETILKLIESKISFKTIHWEKASEKWIEGRDIHVINVNGCKYLTTK